MVVPAKYPTTETNMSLTALDKEVVAVAISVAAGCRPCTTHHLIQAHRAGASDSAIETAVAGAICVRSSATEGMRRHALGLAPQGKGCGCASTTLMEELSALGASLAVNCTENIGKHLAAARALGASLGQLDEVLALAEKIRSRAVDHAEACFRGNCDLPRGTTWAEAPTSLNCC